MRPGQAAPEFFPSPNSMYRERSCFNEAGAGCPGIPVVDRIEKRQLIASMRPGQAAPEFLFLSWLSHA